MTQAVPASIEAVVAILVISFVTPYLTKLLTKPGAPAYLTSGVSLLIQGLAAVGLYLGNLKGVPDWPHALGVFVAALGVTAGTRNVDLGLEGKVAAATAKIGIGGNTGNKAPDDGATNQAATAAYAAHGTPAGTSTTPPPTTVLPG